MILIQISLLKIYKTNFFVKMPLFFLKYLSLITFFTLPNQQIKHPFFVSVTEIEHNAKDKILEISCKIFTDDFEKTLRKNLKNTTIDLLNPAKKDAMSKLIDEYIKNHLQIKINDITSNIKFIGYEQQEEGIVSFYEIKNISAIKKISVVNNILFEYQDKQINIVHASVGGNRKSSKLSSPNDTIIFDF
jgi:hypothetical protein